MEKLEFFYVKAHYGNVVKRFSLCSPFTYAKLINMLKELLEIDSITNVKFMDEENDLITVSTEEEFIEALKTAPKTDGTLKLFVNECNTVPQVLLKKETNNHKKLLKENNFNLKLKTENNLQRFQSPKQIASPTLMSDTFNIKDINQDKIHYELLSNAFNHVSSADDKKRRSGHSKKNKKTHKSSSDDSTRSSSSTLSSSSDEDSCSSVEIKIQNEVSYSRLKKNLKSFKNKILNETAIKLQHFEDSIKNEMTTNVTNAVLKNLEGAVIHSVPGSNIVNSSQFKKNSRRRYQHPNVTCDSCKLEICGPRYKCGNCSDYDLCEECESTDGIHPPSHVFLKLHYPSSHAGRKIGGKSRPLLQTNIYEEREKEREKEDLLQRKLSSGSEINVKAFEEMGNLKSKIHEAEMFSEIFESKKSEWKKLKKEAKKKRKILAKKLKQHGKFIYKSCDSNKGEWLAEQKHKKDLKDFSSFLTGYSLTPTKTDSIIDEAHKVANQSNIFDAAPSFKSVDNFSDHAESTQSDSDIVVVKTGHFQVSNSGFISKPDLVDCTSECLHSTSEYSSEYTLSNNEYPNDYSMTDDFIVVSKVFDLNVPIDGYQYLSAVKRDVKRDDQFFKGKQEFQSKTEYLEYPDLGQSQSSQQMNAPSSELLVDLVSNINLNTCNTLPTVPDHVTLPTQIVDKPADNTVLADLFVAPVDLVAHAPLISSQPPDITMSGSLLCAEKCFDRNLECQNAVTSQPDNLQPKTAIITQPTVDCRRKVNQSLEKDSIRLIDQACAFNESNKLLYDSNVSVSHDNKNIPEMNHTVSNPISKNSFSASNVASPKPEHCIKYDSYPENAVIARGHPNRIDSVSASNEMQHLLNMGFFDRKLNQQLLIKNNNHVEVCIDELLKLNDNNWSNLRH